MARTNEIEMKEKLLFVSKHSENYTKEDLATFFGIEIKLEDKELYNVYNKEGTLIFPMQYKEEVEELFKELAVRFARKLCSQAEKDENHEEVMKKVQEMESKELENERKNYYQCPICNRFHKKWEHHIIC